MLATRILEMFMNDAYDHVCFVVGVKKRKEPRALDPPTSLCYTQ